MIRLQPQPKPVTRDRRETIEDTRFGSGATAVSTALATEAKRDIKHMASAEKLYRVFGKLSSIELRKFNLSLEDWAGRFLTIFGVYLPQAYFSVKEKKHVWETNGRNALVWAMTLGVYILSKSEKFGINLLLNEFMRPKETLEESLKRNLDTLAGERKDIARGLEKARELQAGTAQKMETLSRELAAATDTARRGELQAELATLRRLDKTKAIRKGEKKLAKLTAAVRKAEQGIERFRKQGASPLRQKLQNFINKYRLEDDYFKLLEEAGIKTRASDRNGAYWAKMDDNKIQTMIRKYESLMAEMQKAKGIEPKEAAGFMEKLRLRKENRNFVKALEQELKAGTLEKKLAEKLTSYKAFGKFLNRRNIFNLTNTAMITALIVYLIGGVAMKIVYNTVAKLDPDFNPNRNKPAAPSPGPDRILAPSAPRQSGQPTELPAEPPAEPLPIPAYNPQPQQPPAPYVPPYPYSYPQPYAPRPYPPPFYPSTGYPVQPSRWPAVRFEDRPEISQAGTTDGRRA